PSPPASLLPCRKPPPTPVRVAWPRPRGHVGIGSAPPRRHGHGDVAMPPNRPSGTTGEFLNRAGRKPKADRPRGTASLRRAVGVMRVVAAPPLADVGEPAAVVGDDPADLG